MIIFSKAIKAGFDMKKIKDSSFINVFYLNWIVRVIKPEGT